MSGRAQPRSWSPPRAGSRKLIAAVVLATLATAMLAAAASASPTFSKLSAELLEPRYTPAVATLPNGNVLVAGGYNTTRKFLKSAEVFEPATGNFKAFPAELNVERDEAATVVLHDGRVLIVGGYNSTLKSLKSAEVFDPAAGVFEKVVAPMLTVRDGPAAAVLADGRVLIVGGAGEGKYPTSLEIYDPAAGTFEEVKGLKTAERYEPIAATLPDGRVLIAGGSPNAGPYSKTAEVFDPATGTLKTLEGTGHELAVGTREMGAAVLQNGLLLLVGGYTGGGGAEYLAATQLFNPFAGVFEPLAATLVEPRAGAGAATMADGRVLIAGGYNEAGINLKTAEETAVGPPAAATAAASAVGVNTATLHGSVLAETNTSVYFQYGTSTAYGSSTPRQPVAASLGGLPAAASAGGLAPATTYHFRIAAENVAGTSFGADMTFTTAPAPPTPPTITAAGQSHSRWRTGSALARISRGPARPPVGTTFTVSLDQTATLSFAFAQQLPGRKAGGRCVAQTRSNRTKRRCTRSVARGTLSLAAHAGTNKVAFQGRLTRARKLGAGTYTVLVSATNSARLHSATRRLSFTIVR